MLQGTLDVFSLDEVLGLLSGAKKTGVLNVTGDRGVGSVAIAEGLLVAGSVSANADATALSDVVFELLRFEEGSFSFDGDSAAEGEPNDLEAVLIDAHSRLEEWRGIESVVPSLGHHLSLAEQLPAADVSIAEPEWAAIVAIGEGATVGTVADRLGLGEFDGSKRVMGLVDRSLVSISAAASAPSTTAPQSTPDPMSAPDLSTPVDGNSFDSASFESASFDSDSFDTASFETPDVVSSDDADVADEPVSAEAVVAEIVTAETVSEIPPMPEAPAAVEPAAVEPFADEPVAAERLSDIPPMPEPPSHFGEEAALAGEFAAPIATESVDALPAPDNASSASFAGLDPVGPVDMFEPPQRADEMPPPPPPAQEIPSFAPPAFDPDAFPVNDESVNPFASTDDGPAVSAFGDAGFGEAPFAEDAPAADAVEAPAEESDEDDAKGGSLLMRYLKSNG